MRVSRLRFRSYCPSPSLMDECCQRHKVLLIAILLVVSLNVEKTVTITIVRMHAVSSLNGFSCDELEDLHVHHTVHDTA